MSCGIFVLFPRATWKCTSKALVPKRDGGCPPSLPFSITTAISSSVKRFERGYKPRPATGETVGRQFVPIKRPHNSQVTVHGTGYRHPCRYDDFETHLCITQSGTGVAPPSLPFSIITAISSSFKRFERGYKPRPSTGSASTTISYRWMRYAYPPTINRFIFIAA